MVGSWLNLLLCYTNLVNLKRKYKTKLRTVFVKILERLSLNLNADLCIHSHWISQLRQASHRKMIQSSALRLKPSLSMKILSINNFTTQLISKLLSDLYIGVHLKGSKKFGSKVINRNSAKDWLKDRICTLFFCHSHSHSHLCNVYPVALDRNRR